MSVDSSNAANIVCSLWVSVCPVALLMVLLGSIDSRDHSPVQCNSSHSFSRGCIALEKQLVGLCCGSWSSECHILTLRATSLTLQALCWPLPSVKWPSMCGRRGGCHCGLCVIRAARCMRAVHSRLLEIHLPQSKSFVKSWEVEGKQEAMSFSLC